MRLGVSTFKAAIMLAEVTWRSTAKVESIRKLDSVLDAIAAEVSPERPQAVQITRSNGDCLTVVLGARSGSILNFVAQSGDPPYFSSIGDPAAKGVFTFFVAEDHHFSFASDSASLWIPSSPRSDPRAFRS